MHTHQKKKTEHTFTLTLSSPFCALSYSADVWMLPKFERCPLRLWQFKRRNYIAAVWTGSARACIEFYAPRKIDVSYLQTSVDCVHQKPLHRRQLFSTMQSTHVTLMSTPMMTTEILLLHETGIGASSLLANPNITDSHLKLFLVFFRMEHIQLIFLQVDN